MRGLCMNDSRPAPLAPADLDMRDQPLPQFIVDWGYLIHHTDPKVRAAAARLWVDWNPIDPIMIGG